MAEEIKSAVVILRRKQVELRTGLSRSSIYAKIRGARDGQHDPSFPKPIQIGRRAVGWLSSEIDEWISAQIKKSRTA